ncbi:hypothetical protein KEM54_000305 [Ascosphaera aggregata]|nr:hypothetical protein KEM54_000305 [Ascosphaera aggregata]
MAADDAFLESLFDALADDEGATYWEGIYSQPIHKYERQWVQDENEGFRQMTDDEYAAYVRTEMWKRTREGMLEEQEKRRRKLASWKKEEERAEKLKAERNMFDKLMEESLKRGRERRSRKKEMEEWSDAWKKYLVSWEKLNEQVLNIATEQTSTENHNYFRNMAFWPVRSGKRQDITAKAVEDFLQNAPAVRAVEGENSGDSRGFLSLLKTERVRWHPDKVQHRYGGLNIEKQTMQSVTEVFQIIDRLWNEARERGG